MASSLPRVEIFTKILLNSPIQSTVLSDNWSLLSLRNKQKYIEWFYSDRTKGLDKYWGVNPPKKIYNKDTGKHDIVEDTNREGVLWSEPVSDALIEYFEKFTKESLGITQDNPRGDGMDGGSRRRRRSIPKSSRKFKKSSKRVFRKKSRATRRR
jgi:hypothetical protein